MPIRSSSMGGTPFGNTANRPSSPQVGQTYYNGELGYLEIYTSAGWTSATKAIPYGNTANRPANPAIGQPYFNGQESRLELYTSGTGWQNIIQETPSVVSITGQLNETTTSTIQINGTNFAAGAVAYIVGNDGVEVPANTTTLVSVVEISAVFPAGSQALAPYDVKVVNPSNLYGVLYETLSVNDQPIWSTPAGSLGTFTELQSVSVTVTATDPTDSTNSPLSYSVVSGALPVGLTLNSSTGVISGTPSNVIPNTTYSFTIAATDSRNTAVTRAFSITVNDRGPVWSTGTTLPSFTRNVAYSTTVAATEDDSGAITYSLVSGTLPSGFSLSSSGVISGTTTSSTPATFTIRATVTASGTTSDRTFTLPNAGPVWTTTGTISAIADQTSYSYQLVATDDSGSAPTYSLVSGTFPSGITLSSSGLISGTASISNIETRNFVFAATDANGVTTNSGTISIPLRLAFQVWTDGQSYSGGRVKLYPGENKYAVRYYKDTASYDDASNYSDSNYTFTVPNGVTSVKAFVIGGGGGGSGSNGMAGTGGASSEGIISVSGGSTASVVVGGSGKGANASTDGATNGGTSTFTYSGSSLTAPGGLAGFGSNQPGQNGPTGSSSGSFSSVVLGTGGRAGGRENAGGNGTGNAGGGGGGNDSNNTNLSINNGGNGAGRFGGGGGGGTSWNGSTPSGGSGGTEGFSGGSGGAVGNSFSFGNNGNGPSFGYRRQAGSGSAGGGGSWGGGGGCAGYGGGGAGADGASGFVQIEWTA